MNRRRVSKLCVYLGLGLFMGAFGACGGSGDSGTSNFAGSASESGTSGAQGEGGGSRSGSSGNSDTSASGGGAGNSEAGAAGESGAGATPMLSLLAGALGGPGAADGVGTEARFLNPSGVTSDDAGNLYVADANNATIRKIEIATGAVTTIAGSPGQLGHADGVGADARFRSPASLTFDGAGDLYVLDNGNKNIRKLVLATGVVSTLNAMGVGDVRDLVSDRAGNLFLCTSSNGISQLSVATGTVTLIAGGQQGSQDGIGFNAAFTSPSGLTYDGAANLYVADTGNHTIRKVVIATGAVTTIAGTVGQSASTDGTGADARFEQPQQLVFSGGNLYITDLQANTIRKMVLATGVVSMLVGKADQAGVDDGTGDIARFSGPSGLVMVGADSLYVADSYNSLIRQVIISSAEVSTLAGALPQSGSVDGTGADARFHFPVGLASDDAGNVYVADSGNCTIRRIVLATGKVTTFAGTAGQCTGADGTGADASFSGPSGLAYDGAGNLFVGDTCTVRKVVLATGAVTTLAGTAGQCGSADLIGADARFNQIGGVATDGAGIVYVADYFNSTIRKVIVETRIVSTLAGTAGQIGSADLPGPAARFNYPQGIAADRAGNVYVADSANNTIRKIVVATQTVSTVVGSAEEAGSVDLPGANARFNSPQALTLDGAGNLLVADTVNHTVRKVELATRAVSTIAGVPGVAGVQLGPLPGSLYYPLGICWANPNKILVSSEDAIELIH